MFQGNTVFKKYYLGEILKLEFSNLKIQTHCWMQCNLLQTQLGKIVYEGAMSTLESGINVAPWINVASGKFGKKNKHIPIYTLYLY